MILSNLRSPHRRACTSSSGRATALFAQVGVALIASVFLAIASFAPVAAQQKAGDAAFSSEKIDQYGFPELHVTFNGTGFDVPEAIEGGYHEVVLSVEKGFAGYVDFMQVPTGLAHNVAVDLALEAAAMDVPAEGWAYGGGSFTLEGRENRFLVYLTPASGRLPPPGWKTPMAQRRSWSFIHSPWVITAPAVPAKWTPSQTW